MELQSMLKNATKVRAMYEQVLWEKYHVKLLTQKLRLSEIPKKFRHNPRYARGIYITAFRADRMVSKAQYEEDLRYLEIELILLEAEGNNPSLHKDLENVLDDMRKNLILFDMHQIRDFC
ncbi:hypothetical protein DSECCO2_452180 [anaerobic digester metagenome]